MPERQPCPPNCPRLSKVAGNAECAADLFLVKRVYPADDDLPAESRPYWELQAANGDHTVALARTKKDAEDFREGIDVCRGPKKIKLLGITLFRKCQNPGKSKGISGPPSLRAV